MTTRQILARFVRDMTVCFVAVAVWGVLTVVSAITVGWVPTTGMLIGCFVGFVVILSFYASVEVKRVRRNY